MTMLIIGALVPTAAPIGTQARIRVLAEVAVGRGDT
jgi:hypothetical protein